MSLYRLQYSSRPREAGTLLVIESHVVFCDIPWNIACWECTGLQFAGLVFRILILVSVLLQVPVGVIVRPESNSYKVHLTCLGEHFLKSANFL